jgi:hypothetical protein
LTVLPGWIDAHVHITWIFGKDGKNAGTEGTTQEDAYPPPLTPQRSNACVEKFGETCGAKGRKEVLSKFDVAALVDWCNQRLLDK